MTAIVKLHSKKNGELNEFLSKFYDTNMDIENKFKWEIKYANPVEMTDIISVFVDNIQNFNIKMWISLDKDIYIKISKQNANNIIKYLFERYPY